LIFLGSLGLSSGCFHPYYGHRYPTRYAAHNRPGAYWTGVGLSSAGNVALHAASRQRHPGAALAAAAVGLGLHAAAGANYYHAATAPPRYSSSYHHCHYRPRYRRYYGYGYHHYGCR
jgi:hypothetical protein